MSEVKVNRHGVNTSISYHILDDSIMEANGFSKMNFTTVGEVWSMSKKLVGDISLWIYFPSDRIDQNELEIITIDDTFGQPYDYQSILEHNPSFEYALKVKDLTENYMTKLTEAGILSGHNYGDYI